MQSPRALRSWRLESRVLAGSDDVEMAMLETPTLARAQEGRVIDVGYVSRTESRVLSPTAAACVAQDHLEEVLIEHLNALPAATALRGMELESLTTTDSETTVEILDHLIGEHDAVVADYVVGADGARSRVRASLGVQMVGPDALFGGFRTEFHSPLWDVVGDHRYLLYVPTRPGAERVLLPAGRGDCWVYAVQVDPDTDPTPDADTEDFPWRSTTPGTRRELVRLVTSRSLSVVGSAA